jgi:anti-sigma-K factor RskA
MSLAPDDDFAAAEFALGTLDPGERATLAARRSREPELDAAIQAWEQRLGPLAEAAPPIEPPGDLLAAIQARIRAASSQAPLAPSRQDAVDTSSVVVLRRSVARWRIGAIAASLIAALLAIGLAVRETMREVATREYVAVLQRDAASPAFEVTVNLDRQELTVRPVAAQTPPGKSYELWIIDPKLGPPRSLGVIGDTPRAANLSTYDPAVVQNATYAVTEEPPGGSPNGKPSGPPMFVGKLIPVGP